MFLNNKEPKTICECMERLKKACTLLVTDEYGYKEKDFIFNPPATEKLITKREKELGFSLPEDCKDFFRISNGIRIFRTEIYGVDCIGMNDSFVPDEYLCFGECDSTSERLSFSKDGKFYVCYDFEPEPWNFKDFLQLKLESLEEEIMEHDEEVESEKKIAEGISEEQERAELYAEIDRKFDEMMKKKNNE